MTASTIPVLLLIAVLWWRTKGELLPIILFLSVFDAAAALNFGATALAPWIFGLAICLPIKALTGKMRWRPIPGLNRGAYYSLIAFVVYAVFSSVAFPILFSGILVTNARNGMDSHLTWTVSNMAQAGYLCFALVVFLLALHSTREQLRNAAAWYVKACICLAFFSMWQLANATVHVPYPSALLYTNTTHFIYSAYQISGVWRLNSTMSEASAAAFFLGPGLALVSWELVTRRIRWQTVATFLLLLTALILTVSTLGYCSMATILLGGVFFYLRHSFARRGLSPVKLLVILGLLLAAVPLLLLTDVSHTLTTVFNAVFVNKVNGDSYKERTLWNELALRTAHDSYYFGAGWGSVRASSFVCGVLGDVGIPGLAIFCFFLLQLLRPVFSRRRLARYDLFDRSLFATLVVLVALVVAGSDPVAPLIWFFFAVVTASKPRAFATEPQASEMASRINGPALVPQRQGGA